MARITRDYDFSGYATKSNMLCSDGRVISSEAFVNNDGKRVPLVWQHNYSSPMNVLGHADLRKVSDGVMAYCSLNNSPDANHVRELLAHGDIKSLSIAAGQLKQQNNNVLHGDIKEVSLVLSGANPGAKITDINFTHSDVDDEYYGEAIISTGEMVHAEEEEDDNMASGRTVGEVWDTLNKEQQEMVNAIVGAVLEDEDDYDEDYDEDDYDEDYDDELEQGDEMMKFNVFDGSDAFIDDVAFSHDEMQEIMDDARRCGSLKESVLAHADSYGITNIDILFPDARTITDSPDFIKRRTEWVDKVLSGAKHTPFSRIKSITANITEDEARAKGYIKGKKKLEEVFPVLSRSTSPQTIYKKQKLDRDDVIDITSFDVVAWLKQEMRLMLDEEIARAILLGDGRAINAEDKIQEIHVRPIATDDNLYAVHINTTNKTTTSDKIEAIIRARKYYKGSGNPTMFTTTDFLNDMLLVKDTTGRRIYNTQDELEKTLRVASIVEVEVMENYTYTTRDSREDIGENGETVTTPAGSSFGVEAILVNMSDYNIGADQGGQVSMFDDFDIDYNQQKYLIETRLSGALVKPLSALVIEHSAASGASAGSRRSLRGE